MTNALVKNAVVVTRHSGLIDYLRAEGIIDDTAVVIEHASPAQIEGKNVIGVLPHSLSCLTNSFTEVPLFLPPELRGKELSVDDVRKYAQPIVTYTVRVT